MLDLTGKVVLVTGGSRGIGAATVRTLAAAGADVLVHYGRGEAEARSLVAKVGEERATALGADLAQPGAGVALFREALAWRGRVDVLVNNAAVVPLGDTAGTAEADLDLAWAVNVKAPFFLVASLVPAMAERGSGAVVNISSWMSRTGTSGVHAYTASKGAFDVLTRNWAAEFGPSGVRVNAIAPGVVREDPSRPDPGAAAMRGTPYGRILPPDAIAAAAVYLGSQEAWAVHGTTIDVDGGRSNAAIFAG